jgi:regulator of replication initiation timing
MKQPINTIIGRQALRDLETKIADLEEENSRITKMYARLNVKAATLSIENERLRKALESIQEMADEDIREGTEGVFTAQIEADARAVLKLQGENE